MHTLAYCKKNPRHMFKICQAMNAFIIIQKLARSNRGNVAVFVFVPVFSECVWDRFCVQREIEDTTVLIMDALVGHLHHIRVRAQDAFINHSQWSEWSQVVQAQPWSGEQHTHTHLRTHIENPQWRYSDNVWTFLLSKQSSLLSYPKLIDTHN